MINASQVIDRRLPTFMLGLCALLLSITGCEPISSNNPTASITGKSVPNTQLILAGGVSGRLWILDTQPGAPTVTERRVPWPGFNTRIAIQGDWLYVNANSIPRESDSSDLVRCRLSEFLDHRSDLRWEIVKWQHSAWDFVAVNDNLIAYADDMLGIVEGDAVRNLEHAGKSGNFEIAFDRTSSCLLVFDRWKTTDQASVFSIGHQNETLTVSRNWDGIPTSIEDLRLVGGESLGGIVAYGDGGICRINPMTGEQTKTPTRMPIAGHAFVLDGEPWIVVGDDRPVSQIVNLLDGSRIVVRGVALFDAAVVVNEP